MRDVPIAQPTPAQHEELTALAEQMLRLSAELQTLTTQVAGMLQTDLGVPKLTEKLLHWSGLDGPALDWPALLAELAKQKISISLPKQMEWKPFYDEQRARAIALQTTRATTDRQIDQLVYALYNLTPADIALVEGQ